MDSSNAPATRRRGWKLYAEAALATVLCGAVAWLLDPLLETADLGLVFLTGVLITAVRGGVGPAIAASGLSFLVLNLLFTDPRYTFIVRAEHDILTLGIFLLVALVTGQLAGRVSDQLETIRASKARMASLADFSRRLTGIVGQDDFARVLVDYLRSTLSLDAIVLLQDYASELVVTAGDTGGGLTDAEQAAVRQAFERREITGRGTAAMANVAWWFAPLVGQGSTLGVLGVRHRDRRRALDQPEQQLVLSMRDQAATALAKVQLAVAMDRARLLTETDRLRTALLSSVSHDLRTPLVSIKGTTTALLQLGDALAPSEKRELLENVVEETERLNRYVQNLLDMTRLGYGVVAARPEWRDVREIAGAARRALQSVLNERSVRITIANGDDLIHTDAALLEQVLVNLLENAAKYSPPSEPIEIDGRRVEGNYELTVCDYGPGVPPADRERVFDLFARARSPNGQVAGSGVGLAICKGFAEALGGSIAVSGRHAAAGACFKLRLPQPKEIPFRGAAE